MAALVIVGIGVTVGVVVLPFVLPWPQHLRWLLASTRASIDPCGFGIPVPLWASWDAVIVTGVDPFLEVAVEVTSEGTGRAEWLRCPMATGSDIARLERWAAAGTPLLRAPDHDGAVNLYGPTFAVLGLQRGHPAACIRGADPDSEVQFRDLTGGDRALLGLAPPADRVHER